FDTEAALKSLAHRGPDASGHFAESVANKHVILGHTRLSIIDLSEAGNQPMHDGPVSMVYNGEVYNYRELKAKYLKGENFRSGTDTEVVLKLYRKLGPRFVEELNGDFAMAILDREQKKLLLYRDRLGVKPLYLHRSPGMLAFASEIKTFKAAGLPLTFDERGIGNFLVFKYSPGQSTLYKEVDRLAPGHFLETDLSTGRETLHRYWSLREKRQVWTGNYADAKEVLRDKLGAAVQRRLTADVPISNYLSGGLDSSIIAHYLRGGDHTHYCAVKHAADLRAEGTTSDGHYARRLADDWGLELTEIAIGGEQLTEAHIAAAARACDDPIADGSVIPAMLIAAQAARKHRVVLSGHGARTSQSGRRPRAFQGLPPLPPKVGQQPRQGFRTRPLQPRGRCGFGAITLRRRAPLR
ncbi:MAG: asparagine synthase (glutamine-hydrolyzing), partial [Flavobacteriales bacterium]|nr:asparagine synthase (glutamine-hydrolyzing) [Flavobacteriales bacterium]